MPGTITLTLTDVRGNPLRDHVQIDLRQHGGSSRYSNTLDSTGSISLQGLETQPSRVYQVQVFPANHLSCSAFVPIPHGKRPGKHHFVFPVDPGSVAGIDAPAWTELSPEWQRVLLNAAIPGPGAPGDVAADLNGEALYLSLSPERKACFLNLMKKASVTPVSAEGNYCDQRLGGLMRIDRDRAFCVARAGFFEEVKHLPEVFEPVSGVLHEPPSGYHLVGSYKTRHDRYGNLQLTFFRKGDSGNEYAVDIDIDEASGLLHVFEVARNQLFDVQTNPYTVREILIRHQGLDPGYDFVFATAADTAAAG